MINDNNVVMRMMMMVVAVAIMMVVMIVKMNSRDFVHFTGTPVPRIV